MTDLVPLTSTIETHTSDGLRNALMTADTGRQQLAEQGDYPQLLAAYQYLKTIKADIDTLMRATEDDIVRLLPEKKQFVDGVGTVEKRTSATRKWQSEDLMRDLCRASLDPNGTGEISLTNVATMLENLKKVLPLTASLGWRVTALKELGINPDTYGEATYNRTSIQITK